jgi:hypothetical protein
MSERDPDLSAAVYVAIISGLMLLCLIGALVLPASISLNKYLGYAALVGLFVGIPVLDRMAHRSRIEKAIEELGGSVVRIKRLPFWRQSHIWSRRLPIARRIKHEVDYADAGWQMHRAVCFSGWFHGVEWLEDVVEEC